MATRELTLLSVVIFVGLFTITFQQDDEDCRKLRGANCIDDRAPSCTGTSHVVSCAENLVTNAKNCKYEVKNTIDARLRALKYLQKAVCDDKDLQKAFGKTQCWKGTARCVVDMMLKPLSFDKKMPPKIDCQNAQGGMNSCAYTNGMNCDTGIAEKFVNRMKRDLPCPSCANRAIYYVTLTVVVAFAATVWN